MMYLDSLDICVVKSNPLLHLFVFLLPSLPVTVLQSRQTLCGKEIALIFFNF